MFVAGLHFGTQNTSVAFAHSDSPDNGSLVRTWPGGTAADHSSYLVPTQIAYNGRTIRWGYEVSNSNGSSEPLKFLKLLLTEPDTHPQSVADGLALRTTTLRASSNFRAAHSYALGEAIHGAASQARFGGTWLQQRSHASLNNEPSLKSSPPCFPELPQLESPRSRTLLILEKLNITPLTAVADFLSKVRETTLSSMERFFGSGCVRAHGVKWTLTVPATWCHSAEHRMVQAAQQAGFGEWAVDFELVSEWECVAAYVLTLIPGCLSTGDSFVLCDAGEGTVDLITYRIASLSPLCLERVVSESGDLCGSLFVDMRFEDYIRRKLGGRIFDSLTPRSKSTMMRSWEEQIRLKFGGVSHHWYEVCLPGVPNDPVMKVEDCFHTMGYEDVKSIFDPVVDRIIDLVSSQVREVQEKGSAVEAIVLVGSFGASEYLRKCLQNRKYGDRALPVLQPMNGDRSPSAAARGALLRGIDSFTIMRRFSRRNLGSYYHERSTADNDLPEVEGDARRCPDETSWLVTDKMEWYVKKHAELKPYVVNFYRVVPTRSGQEPDFVFLMPLYTCDDDDAPAGRWQNASAVHRLCTLTLDLGGIPRQKLTRFRNLKGEAAFYVPFQLRISEVGKVKSSLP